MPKCKYCNDQGLPVCILKDKESGMWTTIWPITPGYYWFYGHFTNCAKELLIIKVSQTSVGCTWEAWGVPDTIRILPSDWHGMWQPLIEPVLPGELRTRAAKHDMPIFGC